MLLGNLVVVGWLLACLLLRSRIAEPAISNGTLGDQPTFPQSTLTQPVSPNPREKQLEATRLAPVSPEFSNLGAQDGNGR